MGAAPLLSKINNEDMKKMVVLVFLVSLLTGCRCKAVTVTQSERHADSTATLTQRTSKGVDRIVETELLVMRADSLGRLVPVIREVVRHTEHSAENTEINDTVTVTAQEIMDEETVEQKDRTDAAIRERRLAIGILSACFVLFSAIFSLLLIYLYKSWKLKN